MQCLQCLQCNKILLFSWVVTQERSYLNLRFLLPNEGLKSVCGYRIAGLQPVLLDLEKGRSKAYYNIFNILNNNKIK